MSGPGVRILSEVNSSLPEKDVRMYTKMEIQAPLKTASNMSL